MMYLRLLYPRALPNGEHEAAWFISRALDTLDTLVDEFTAAVQLIEYCETERARATDERNARVRDFQNSGGRVPPPDDPDLERRVEMRDTWRKWSHIAAREGAMIIYHFAEAVHGVKDCRDAPTLKRLRNEDCRKDAAAIFNRVFHGFYELRAAVAHRTRPMKSMERDRHHSEGAGGLVIPGIIEATGSHAFRGGLFDRRYVFTWRSTADAEPVHYSYELTYGTRDTLGRVRDLLYKMYEPAEKELKRIEEEKFWAEARAKPDAQ